MIPMNNCELDVKYIINQNSQEQSRCSKTRHFGATWFVKAIKPVANDAERIVVIGHKFEDNAVVQQSYMQGIEVICVADSSASNTLKKYSNDEIEYTTNAVNAQFAVLSRFITLPVWNAYIDGRK